MKSILLLPLLLMMLVLTVISCGLDLSGDDRPIRQKEMNECHDNVEWDTEKVTNKLIGKWVWEYRGCNLESEESRFINDEELVLDFKSDSTLLISRFGDITDGTWSVSVSVGDIDIVVDPNLFQLSGELLICDNRMEFDVSLGCDDFFIKVE